MALLQNEDFTIWQLRSSYLSTIKDGVGDRLINVNSSILNTPSFRAAGWSSTNPLNAGNNARSYSPPIPTTAAVASEYFQVGQRNGRGDKRGDKTGNSSPDELGFGGIGDDGDDEEGGMVTGGRGSTDTIGPRQHGRSGVRRIRRRERLQQQQQQQQDRQQREQRRQEAEDDDSSDLSDESDEEPESRAAQQIKFAKMPVRERAGSSPIRSRDRRDDGPEVLITSPSRRSVDSRYRRGSLGAVEAVKARERRDTATSSEMSSENELDPSVFKRRQIHFSNQDQIVPGIRVADDKFERDGEVDDTIDELNENDDDSGAESVGSALSSEFGATSASASLLDDVGIGGPLNSASPLVMQKLPAIDSDMPSKKAKSTGGKLQGLPPSRPISAIPSASLLSNALKAKRQAPVNPVEKFGVLSAKGSTDALHIKIYTPSSSSPDEPFDMSLSRVSKDGEPGSPVTVEQAIGLSLFTYKQEGLKPPIEGSRLAVNKWTLRMVEDGEVEYDFPPLARGRPIMDFTSNNNRSAAGRGRSRSKPFDEFALVEATEAEFQENEKLFPQFSVAAAGTEEPTDTAQPTPVIPAPPPKPMPSRQNPILGQPFSSALNDSTLTPADRPALPTTHATPRMGVNKTLRVRFIDPQGSTQVTSMSTSSDSYIAEILENVCRKWGLDRGNHILKVLGSNTIAPLDRTVEALGNITELDLVRRRFGAAPLSLTGSPGTSSPNAPLLIDNTTNGQGKKGKKGGAQYQQQHNQQRRQQQMLHPLAQKQDFVLGYYRRYNVIRKQSMSFTTSSQRVLAFDTEYMHIMPGETGRTLFESNTKTTSISFNDVVGSKVSRRHPKSFRVVVLRNAGEQNEQKRYDFEAKSAAESAEIVDEIKKNMAHYRM
ncbi:hypothetical protein FQN54_005174 [Arachnomyces sp. PD_36]|nr:hypothetical protein FQN54_005174 [Arachnomyces sp. PD_36]